MERITIEELCSVPLCDYVAEGIDMSSDADIVIMLSGGALKRIKLVSAKLTEIRIKGYEVLDENEEVVFDMPDVEILGDKIPEAILTLMQSKPHIVGFSHSAPSTVLTLTDETDTYEIEMLFAEVFTE